MNQPCKSKVEVYSRVCGFYRPVQQWNVGKKAEFADRVPFRLEKGVDHDPENSSPEEM